jgi:NAD(P)-dependent dehydrogenase (short-subunit alcohol dehydrogenase family)
MRDVIVVIGPGQIGQAIARRVAVGKHVLLADLRQDNADAAAEVLGNAGYEVSVATVDVSLREAVHALVETATGLGDVTGLIHAAGVSPSQASPATILKVDLYGTALVLEEFGNVIAGGALASSSRRSLGTAFPRSASNIIRRWPPPRWKSCSAFRSFSPTKSRILSTRTRSRSAGTRCG